MRKFIVSSVCVLGLVSLHTEASVHYVIKGEMPDKDGRTVYLLDYDTNQRIDSTLVSNGSFKIEGNYDRDACARVECETLYSNCILDGEVTLDFESHSPKAGSSLNMLFNGYRNQENEYFTKMESLEEKLTAEGKNEEEISIKTREYCNENFPQLMQNYEDGILSNQNGLGEALMLTFIRMVSDAEHWSDFYAKLSPRLLECNVVKKANNRFEKLKLTSPGRPFVNFSGKDIDGKEIQLSDFVGKGKYVLVDFWASWCGPCRMEAREVLKPLYERLKGNPKFEILSVAVWDNPTATRKAIAQEEYRWPQMIDAGKTPMELYGFDGVPQIMLFSPEGMIMDRNLRGRKLVETVDAALSENR